MFLGLLYKLYNVSYFAILPWLALNFKSFVLFFPWKAQSRYTFRLSWKFIWLQNVWQDSVPNVELDPHPFALLFFFHSNRSDKQFSSMHGWLLVFVVHTEAHSSSLQGRASQWGKSERKKKASSRALPLFISDMFSSLIHMQMRVWHHRNWFEHQIPTFLR